MISAFGVEHTAIEKLAPQVRGNVHLMQQNDQASGQTTTYPSTHMYIGDTGKKTLLLRRKKYEFDVQPSKKTVKRAAATGKAIYAATARSKPGGKTKQEINQFLSSGARKGVATGLKLRRTDVKS